MASYGVFLAACGFSYHGPKGQLGFGPRLTPENFKAPFTTAEGWGSLIQRVQDGEQINTIQLHYGKLLLTEFTLDTAPGAQLGPSRASIDQQAVAIQTVKSDSGFTINFLGGAELIAGQMLSIT